MRKLFTVLALLLVSLAKADDTSVLRAIAVREGVKDVMKPGSCGERGYHQLMPGTWASYTREPFIKASTDPALETAIAEKHLLWIRSQLIHHHIPDDTYHEALVWNAGWGNILRGTAKQCSKDYAQNVVDIEATLRK